MNRSVVRSETAKVILVGVLAILLISVFLASIGIAQESKYGGVLVMAYHDPNVFNPIVEYGFQAVTRLCFNGLIDLDVAGRPVPSLAESWDISSDALTYTFHLREDVKWNDGAVFTARDVKFTYDTILDPANNIIYIKNFVAVESVEILDEFTVVFTLSEPSAPFLAHTWIGILPEHIWENEDLHNSDYNTYPVGTGPWKIEEWVRMDHVTLVANELYFRGRPYLDRVIMKVIPDATVAFVALERGDIDYFPYGGIVGGLPYEQVDPLKNNPNLVVNIFKSSSQQQLWFRTNDPPFDDVKVRRAIAYAIDREYIVDTLLFGYGTVVHSDVPPTVGWAYNPDTPKYEYDPERSETLLDEAGYPRGEGGVRFETMIYGTPGSRRILSEILKEQLRAVGIEARLEIADWTTYINKIRVERTHHGLWTIISIPKSPDPDELVKYVVSWQIKPGGINPSMYNNPILDDLVVRGKVETEIDKRREIYCEFQEIIAEDLPTFPLYLSNAVDIWSKDFEGFYSSQWAGGSITCLETVWKVR